MAAHIRMEVGDVVQLSPELDRFAACFMVVTEPKSWGAQGYVRVPGGGDAYYRAKNEDMELVGKAVWIHEGEQP